MAELVKGASEEPLGCSILIYRVLLRNGLIDDAGNVQSGAFMPRPNGSDDTGLSVERANMNKYSSLKEGAQVAQNRFKRPKGVVTLHTGKIRDLTSIVGIVIDIIPNKTEENPEHALIVGLPLILDAPIEDIGEIERIAGKLAKISRVII